MIGTISVDPHSGHRRVGLLVAGRRMGDFFIVEPLAEKSLLADLCESLFDDFLPGARLIRRAATCPANRGGHTFHATL
jgi:hypothetical protein